MNHQDTKSATAILPAADPLLPASFEQWFARRGWAPREHQLAMVEQARLGRHTLLIAPTGGGKTLAGFLPSLVDLHLNPPAADGGVHTLYLSPLKALAVDVERNLMEPIRQIGLDVTVEARTGDTGVSRRQRQREKPPHILLTTPEQLALFCAWPGAREYFAGLHTVIIDEIHSLYGGKRGDLLNLGLARLQAFSPRLRRVGLSATVNEPDLLRAWLSPQMDKQVPPPPGEGRSSAARPGGELPSDPPTSQNTTLAPTRLSPLRDERHPPAEREGLGATSPALADLVLGAPGAPAQIDVLVSEGRVPWAGHTARHAMAEVYEAVRQAKTALVFVNTRWQAEFAFQELWRLNDEDLPIALHHGSLSADRRRRVEAAMARGELRAIVCTSTLDLGIDWGDVDLVIQLAAPKGSSRLVQRIGRANHRLDEPSRALLVPASRFEMLECQAAREAVAENALDGDPERVGALDALAQHVMGVACGDPFDLQALYEEVRACAPFAHLTWEDWETVVDFVSTGGYALRTYDKFRRIVQGPDGLWRARNGQIAQRHRLNVGAIAAVTNLAIRVGGKRGQGGRKIGEAEEWYFEQLVPGDTFLFGGEVWRFEGIRGLDAFVTPAADKEPKVPSWGGSKFPLSTYLARRVRTMISEPEHWRLLPTDVCEWLDIQRQASVIPDPDEMLLETFPRGKRHYLIVYPFEGRIAHSTLAMLLTRRLERAGVGPLGFVATDYALAIWSARDMGALDHDALFEPDMLGDDLEAWLDESFLMKRSFRNCAMVAGLIERRFPGEEKTGRQVTFSADLIYDVLRKHQPDHLLLRCAREDAATGLLDIARLGDLLMRIQGRIRAIDLPKISPFAVPLMLQIGRERVNGEAAEEVLEMAEAELIAEAMSGYGRAAL